MTILKYQIFGGNSVGVYLAVNNSYGLYPSTLIASTIEIIKSVFSEPFFPISINNSTLLGVYTASNINGIIVPHIIRDDELQNLKMYTKDLSGDYQIGVLKSLDNAFGNLILCNDKGAIISSFLKEYKNLIEDTLNVETVVYEYVNISLPGSISVANNKGCLVHPLTTDEEIEVISDILKVNETDVSTVNRGIPYLSSGAVVNDRSGFFGNACTGPEMMRLTNVLML
ncbi:MAG TPA: translation initiation factor IF-6 [Candidatus Nanopelagicaceae bacterium]|nr:translation initiation factor IF-6 [Candidatus Nanopelagicaceae bacterium]